MIAWRFLRGNTRKFGGTQHAFSDAKDWLSLSLCGKIIAGRTIGTVRGFAALPGQKCKTCRRMAETQQEFQQDPGGAR